MSKAELRNGTPPPPDQASSPIEVSDDSIPADPLLGSGAFIDPDRNDSGAESSEPLKFDPLTVIAATPISMVAPDDDSPETASRVRARRNPEEMAKRPSWLPEDWKIDLKVRTSGATAGLIDRYYIEPSGQRKFRSKNEVLHFLETGNKLKRKPNAEENAEPSASPASSQKEKKASAKRKKPEASSSGAAHSPQVFSSVHADAQKT